MLLKAFLLKNFRLPSSNIQILSNIAINSKAILPLDIAFKDLEKR